MIISHSHIIVNPKKYEKWTMKKELNTRMAVKMLQAGFDDRARRMRECSDKVEISFCPDCGAYEITRAKLCRDRLCPVCSWRLSIKRYAEMSAVCAALIKDYPVNKWSLMTLTVQNCAPALLDQTLTNMAAAFNRMRQRKVFKQQILGWARTVEVTFNSKENTVHPHYHVLVMWAENSDIIQEGARLINHWIASCRDLMVSYKGQNIKEIDGSVKEAECQDITGAVLETFKYTQKASDLLSMPIGVFREYTKNMARKRAVAFGGLIKEYMQKLHFKMDDEADEIEPIKLCKNCGNAALSKAIYQWSFAERSYLLSTDLSTEIE